MKAAVIYEKGGAPFVTEVDEPEAKNPGEKIIAVRAAAIKHIDKTVASGKHYSSEEKKRAKIIGGDGVGLLDDGTRVYALGVSGMVAEKAIIETGRTVRIPAGLDDVTAAAIPNAVAGSAMALRFRAGIQPGETVLINGATGFTGRIAVQLAKHYGAKTVIATGRNAHSLEAILSLGADEIISLRESDSQFVERLKDINSARPITVVIDYLWGHSAELILGALMGKGSYTNRVRYVSVGSVTGDRIALSAANLRSVDLQLSGSGLGSWTAADVKQLFSEILPEAFQLAAHGKLKLETVTVDLRDLAESWDRTMDDGKRLVVRI